MSKEISISNSLQDYLEEILNLTEKYGKARITDLAKSLQIAKPSVTSAVKTLVDLRLLKHEKYGPLELTQYGRRKALEIRRRHRALMEFLTDILGVDPETAEKEACLMEHAISSDTLLKLVRFLKDMKLINLEEELKQ